MSGSAEDLLVQAQRDITRVCLGCLSDRRFALAGSGAIREHGITQRPTEDVDLFTDRRDTVAFGAAAVEVVRRLTQAGYQVEQTRQAPEFVRLVVVTTSGAETNVDLGVDWRQHEPVTLEIGAVLSLSDAVGSKLAALYGRAAARDVLDVDSIRASRRFTDVELLAMLAEREPGVDLAMFAEQLRSCRRLTASQVRRYGVTGEQLAAVQQRLHRLGRDDHRRRRYLSLGHAPVPGAWLPRVRVVRWRGDRD